MLLLFDIDGTLLLGASDEHVAAFREAVSDVYGIDPRIAPSVEAAGRTDLEIARTICLAGGVSARRFEEQALRFRERCVEAYARLVPSDLSGRVAPGVAELLAELARRDHAHLALLTGNLEPIARMKLRAAGLARYFDAGQGGFGSDHEDRTMLPAIARRRAASLNAGAPYPRGRTVVIGDTPRDIACARADGVRAVAIASGPYAADDLRDADAVVATAHELLDVL